ncbi:MAG: glutathione S-transferase family protein [Proteobacteria bacterium]|nr:glutathione S-transferase family protein [Pseudomonadota bacterium]
MTTLTLISHHLCPYVQRVAIALREKAVPFEQIYIDLGNKPDWFKRLSPLGKVPLLKVGHDGGTETVLFESSVIAEYIEEALPGRKLHPADALTKAQHRGWMEFGSAALGDIWRFETAQDAAGLEAARAALSQKFDRLEEALGDGPYFAGRDFSLVDAVFAPAFRYFDVFDTYADFGLFTGRPKLSTWRQALADRASVMLAVTPDYPNRLNAFLKAHDWYLLPRAA